MSAQLVGGWVPFPGRVAEGQPVDDPARSRLDLGLLTAVVAVGRGEGFGAELQLPFGFITRFDTVSGRTTDPGLGDLEARARYSLGLGRVRLSAALGAALPTGQYAARSGTVALFENARYLSLGRGVVWGLADLEARLELPARFSLALGGTGRLPLYDARDGFRWGPEARAVVSVSSGPWFDRFAVGVALEAQYRAASSEIDLFTTARVDSGNTGGTWLTVTPTAQLRVYDSLTVFCAARLPVTQFVRGLQFVPGPGVFAGVGGSWDLSRPAPSPAVAAAPALEPGVATLVDYTASWCEPCQRLSPLIDAAQLRYPELRVQRIDVSDWPPEMLAAAVPGAQGVPLVEVRDAQGRLVRRLEGAEVFGFEPWLKEALCKDAVCGRQ